MNSDFTIAIILQKVILSLATISCIINILIIILQKLKGRLTTIILFIQLFFLIYCICVLIYYPQISLTNCKITAYISQSAWTCSNLFILILVYTIKSCINNKRIKSQKYINCCMIVATILPFIVFAIPFNKYSQYEIGDHAFSCSLDTQQIEYWIYQFGSSILIFIVGIIMIYSIYKNISVDLTEQKKQAKNMLPIPMINFILLFINLFTKAFQLVQHKQLRFWIFGILNLSIYSQPILNLWLYIRFINKSPSRNVNYIYFKWIFSKSAFGHTTSIQQSYYPL